MKLILIPALVVLFWVQFCAAIELKTAAQESYPKYIHRGDAFSGICFEVIEAIEALDSEIEIVGKAQFLPFKRIQEYLANGQLDVFLGLKKRLNEPRNIPF